MPAAAAAAKKAGNKRQRSKRNGDRGAKKQKTNKNQSRVVATDDMEELSGDVDSWDWSEVKTPNAMLTDDMAGFLCLEEIDDVHVEYEMDEKKGKVAKFKRVKKANRLPGKRATPEEPLSLGEHKGFYHIDTFDEKLAARGQIVKNDDAESAEEDTDKKRDDYHDDDAEEEEELEEVPVEDEEEDEQLEEVSVDENDYDEDLVQLEEVSVDDDKEDDDDDENAEQMEEASADEHEEEEELEDKQDKSSKTSKRDKKKKQKDAKKEKSKVAPGSKPVVKLENVDQSFDVSGWQNVQLAEPIVNALKYYKFDKPTPIQEKALPRALNGKDIIGVAETGSGKTLAFGIPIVQYLITAEKEKEKPEGLTGLILAPTRELAIQVKDHIQNIAVFTDIKVAAVVGGMSPQKQHRLLKQKPDIIVATPGRLWEIFSEEDEYMEMLKGIKFLVLDEADRMLEKGRFEELTNILNELSTKKKDTTNWPEELEANKPRRESRYKGSHQTFVFTATLNQDIQALRSKKKFKGKKRAPGSMADLLKRLELENKNPSIIDITTENRVASRLAEAKIECLKNEKDLYVYYFVTRYPGRTIVFVNSIDAIRRFVPIFKLLGVEVLSLHAQMQQRQRLKNLDRFKANEKAILVASDVAARGLDIPLVEHVIHYQLPRTSEIYVHRSGRTARANRDGISLLLCSPEEIKQYRSLRQSLRKGKDYPDFPVDMSLLSEMRKRVNLATDIDQLEHQEEKASHDVNWMRKMAKEADLDFDEDMLDKKKKDNDDDGPSKKRKKAQINAKRAELEALLSKPMLPMGVSGRYLTSSMVSDLVDRLLENEGKNTLLPTLATSRAVQEVKKH